MRQPKEQIRESILEQTPIGMNINDVLEVVKNNGWRTEGVTRPGVVMEELGRTGSNVGVKSIRADIGKYTNLFVTYIDVFWAFDENSELIEVFVIKGTVGF